MMHKRKIKTVVLLLFVAVTCMFAFGAKTLAAAVYNTDSSAGCSSGDPRIDSPKYKKDGKSYYCITGTQPSDLVNPVNGQCPPGSPGTNTPGFLLCINPERISVQTLPPLKTPKGGGSGHFCGQDGDSKVET